MADITKEQVIEYLSNLNIMELMALKSELEETWGVDASAAVAVAAAPGGAAAGPVAEEQTEFDVILEGFGDKKIGVIKVVRQITGIGLKEAKELVEGVPKPIKEGCDKEEAEKIKAQLEEAGATVALK